MSRMIRKQIYIQKRQEALLKRPARTRGVSEAELIREAIDRQLDPEAFEQTYRFRLARRRLARGQPYRWKRADAYAERPGRFERERTGPMNPILIDSNVLVYAYDASDRTKPCACCAS